MAGRRLVPGTPKLNSARRRPPLFGSLPSFRAAAENVGELAIFFSAAIQCRAEIPRPHIQASHGLRKACSPSVASLLLRTNQFRVLRPSGTESISDDDLWLCPRFFRRPGPDHPAFS